MEISFCTAPGNLRKDIGYGYAAYNMIKSIQRLGHTVPYDDKRSPVQINWSQPNWYHLRENQYSIGYTPWESTLLPPEWPGLMNKADEIWTTSGQCKEWFINSGVEREIYVYEHGIEPMWTPKLRKPSDKIKFLHIGEPAVRKGGKITYDAFRAAFGNQDDVHLTIKAFAESRFTIDAPNVSIKTDVLQQEQLLNLYHGHDVLVYPSYGEGFGFIPLQAIATGMPTIATEWWCSYSKFILPLESTLVPSPWPDAHCGDMAKPDFDDLVQWMRTVYDTFTSWADMFYRQATVVHDEYNWDRKTAKVLEHLNEKFA